MSYLGLVAGRARAQRQLVDVLVELTYRCNLDCFFCYNDRSLGGSPLTLEHYERLLEDLGRLGVWSLTLSGGEPLAHPDFFAIGAKARRMGFVVRIKTNGHALHRALAERIRREIDPYVLEISLHGATAPIHDRQTRVAGSFERLMGNLAVLSELDQRVRLRGTLTAWNAHEVDAMFALADGLGVPLDMHCEVTARDDGDTAPLALRPSGEARARLRAILNARHAQGRGADLATRDGPEPHPRADQPHCGAGTSGLAIDPVGNVYPCVQWRRRIGNLHAQRIGEIWADSAVLARVREDNVVAARRVASLDGGAAGASFCPGSAEHATGRADGIYYEYRVQLEAIGRPPREAEETISGCG